MNDAGPPHNSKEKKKQEKERRRGKEMEMEMKMKTKTKMKWYLSVSRVTKMESDPIALAPSPPSVPTIKCTSSFQSG